jgi:hypothetical protein
MTSTAPKKSTPSLSDLTSKDKDEDNNSSATSVESQETDTNKDDGNKEERTKTTVSPSDAAEMRANTDSEPSTPKVNHDSRDDSPKSDSSGLSNQVVATVPNKTPAELAAETPRETENRYGIDQTVTDEDADNPRVQVYRDTHVNQVPSGTHLHPDIAKDLLNRGISEQHTDNAQVKRTVTEAYDFAPDAEHNDKF